jgi:hypothetical protein
MLLGNSPAAEAQPPEYPADYITDSHHRLYVYCAFDGHNVKEASEGSPIEINLEGPMTLDLIINVTGLDNLNMSGKIVFYYQSIAVYPIQIVDPVTHSTWIWVNPSLTIDPISAPIPLQDVFSYSGVKVATGLLQASVDFQYRVEGNDTLNKLSRTFYFEIPFTPQDVFTSVTGIAATTATIGALYGVGTGLNSLIDGLKTAYKLRGIHKKASELRSLPNLTVIGALPLLFSMLAGMGKMKKKETNEEEEGREDSGVSEYIVRQRLREAAPDAWQEDKCPQCKRNWSKKDNMCKKCKIGPDEARMAYADMLADKVPRALSAVGKKKSIDIRGLAKKTKSTDYNAGVIAAAMVDTEVTEIVKVGTPLRSFVMNIAGLAFLVITWQQLLGDSASSYQTTITVVGAALSLAVIVALYVSRRTQIQRFQAEFSDDETPPARPTEEQTTGAAVESEESVEMPKEAVDSGEQMHEVGEETETTYGSSEESVDLEPADDGEIGYSGDRGDDSFSESE